MTDITETNGVEFAAGRVDERLAALGQLDETGRAAALALKEAVDALHREGLVTIVRVLRDDPRGRELLADLAGRPEVRTLLLVHGILQPSPAVRAAQVLEKVRPYLQSHGGDVELVDVEGTTAYVRMKGACSGCEMSAQTVRDEIVTTLARHAGIEAVEVVSDPPGTPSVPVMLSSRPSSAPTAR